MMTRQQRQDKNKVTKQIAPKQVWRALTDKQQRQFVQTIEAVCQRVASRLLAQQERHDAAS